MHLTDSLYILLGMNTALAAAILMLIFCLKKHEYWLGFLANALAALFCLSATSWQLSAEFRSIFLASSVAAALFTIPLIWKNMLFQLFEYGYQWLFLIAITTLLIVNQVFINDVVLFLLCSVMVSAVIILRSISQHGELRLRLQNVSLQLEKTTVKVGFDVATGLPNKTAFVDRIEKWVHLHHDKPVNIIAFRITRFKELNALIGHNNADLVKLQLIARLKKRLEGIKEVIVTSDINFDAFFASAGGVSFVIAVRDEVGSYATEKVIDSLKNAIKEPLAVDSTAVDVGVEFGVAKFPDQGNAIESLIENAFLAMEQADQKNGSFYFDDSQLTKLLNKKTIISQLKDDLYTDRFSVFVHPQINLITKQVIGGELLMRWNRDGQGIINAKEFIELAEQSGVIYQLNLWTIERAIQSLAALKRDNSAQTLSVNLSNKELLQSHIVESILNLIDEYMVDSNKLVVEIKESAFAESRGKALKVARLLQQAGVNVAIDDFGRDYTAIDTFNVFKPYYVKVDCRHVGDAKKGSQLNTYTNAIIGLAKSLDIPVVAQGIESEQTESQLLDLGCEYGQGFFYSKPFELAGFNIWLEQWQRNSQHRHN